MIASMRIVLLALGCCAAGLTAFGQESNADGSSLPIPEAAVEAGLTLKDWASILAAYEQDRRGANGVEDGSAQPGDLGTRHAMASGPIVEQQVYLKASNTSSGDGFGPLFGADVSVSGDTIVIGAQADDSNATGVNGDQHNQLAPQSGAAFVFVRSGTTWIQQAYLKATNTGANDRFGFSVEISGDTIVVGAPNEDSSASGVNGNQTDNSFRQSGAAYVFVRNGTIWNQQAYLKASNTGRRDGFASVSVSGDTIVVGAPGERSSATGVNGDQTSNGSFWAGSAYVFVRSGTTWSQQAYVKASNTRAYDRFGRSVSVSNDLMVVGAVGEASNATGVNGDQSNNSLPKAGAAYVFVRSGTSWQQQAYLKASNSGDSHFFGESVAASGQTIVVGAPGENSHGSHSGAAYVFAQTGTTWSEQASLAASNAGFRDGFGGAVSVSGDIAVIGADFEASSATGVNSDQSDNSAYDAGAAYIFLRSGTSWSQRAYLKASNTNAQDYFGAGVSVSSDTVVVGAFGEDSKATGVNGDQSDNSVHAAGAVYVFGTPRPVAYCSGKTTSAGCVPFTSFSGQPSASSGSFFIQGNDHVEGQPGLLIYSTKKGNLDFHGGKLCIKAPFKRMAVSKSTDGLPCTTCAGNCRMLENDFNQMIQAGTDPMLTLGQSVYVQVRQSDPANLGPTGFADNLSNAISFTIGL